MPAAYKKKVAQSLLVQNEHARLCTMSVSFFGASHLVRQGVARALAQRLSTLACDQAIWQQSHGGAHKPCIHRLAKRCQGMHRYSRHLRCTLHQQARPVRWLVLAVYQTSLLCCRCSASLVQLGQQRNTDIHNSSPTYSNPELYDRAFSLRDFVEEVGYSTLFTPRT